MRSDASAVQERVGARFHSFFSDDSASISSQSKPDAAHYRVRSSSTRLYSNCSGSRGPFSPRSTLAQMDPQLLFGALKVGERSDGRLRCCHAAVSRSCRARPGWALTRVSLAGGAVLHCNTLVDPTLKRERRHAKALRIWQAASCPLGAARSDARGRRHELISTWRH